MFVVTEETFRYKKGLLRRFLSAYRDCTQWMINNPNEAAKLAVTRAINGRDEAINLEIIKLRNISSISKTTNKMGLGHFDLDLLQKGAATFKKLDLIKKEIDIRKVMFNIIHCLAGQLR